MDKQQRKTGYEKGRFHLSEPPMFGTITNKLKNETFFYPMKSFTKEFNENMLNVDINRKWKESFYMNMNAYDDGNYLESKLYFLFDSRPSLFKNILKTLFRKFKIFNSNLKII